ncbi:MAG: ComF family protein [Polyangiales bacterium]
MRALDLSLAIARAVADTLTAVVDLVAPRACRGCDAPYVTEALCAACASTLEAADDPPEGVLVPWSHEGPLARAIHRAKYGDDPAVARDLGAMLAPRLAALRGEVDVVVPAPLHRSRLASRGFNQSAELSRAVAEALGARLDLSAVERARATRSQTTLDIEGREANVAGAFRVRAPKRLAGRRVLLVDDVVTTGATLRALGAAVEAAGVTSVRSAALARMTRLHKPRGAD